MATGRVCKGSLRCKGKVGGYMINMIKRLQEREHEGPSKGGWLWGERGNEVGRRWSKRNVKGEGQDCTLNTQTSHAHMLPSLQVAGRQL